MSIKNSEDDKSHRHSVAAATVLSHDTKTDHKTEKYPGFEEEPTQAKLQFSDTKQEILHTSPEHVAAFKHTGLGFAMAWIW